MTLKHEKRNMIFAGLIIGVIASLLVLFGNPKNMGFCIACFLRDTAGGLGLHSAAAVQYIRPEIIGLVLGSFIMAISHKEFSARGGSAPVTRFVLGMFVMVGCLMFLGCPFRMILRLAGGDLNALLGLAGFVCGILAGVFFLNKGYTLKRSHDLAKPEGGVFVILTLVVFALLLLAPAFIHFSEAGAGPGALHAPILISLAAGLIVGALAQRTRLCMVGGPRWCAGLQPDPHRGGRCKLFPSRHRGAARGAHGRPVELPRHAARWFCLCAAGRMPAAAADPRGRGQQRQRHHGARPAGRCGVLPQLRPRVLRQRPDGQWQDRGGRGHRRRGGDRVCEYVPKGEQIR